MLGSWATLHSRFCFFLTPSQTQTMDDTHTEQRHSGCAVWKHIYLELLHDGHIWGPWRIGKEKRKKINKNRPTNEIKGWRHPHETLTVIHTHKHREGATTTTSVYQGVLFSLKILYRSTAVWKGIPIVCGCRVTWIILWQSNDRRLTRLEKFVLVYTKNVNKKSTSLLNICTCYKYNNEITSFHDRP